MDCPLDYGFCDRVVTVYRMERGKLQRYVAENCYYVWQDQQVQDVNGTHVERKFLLIMPGEDQRVFAGDRIYDGVGPKDVDWPRFLPELVPGLSQVEYVRPWYWGGGICHVEAGRK